MSRRTGCAAFVAAVYSKEVCVCVNVAFFFESEFV